MSKELSPMTALMQEYGAPLTRDEYVKWNNLGKKAKVTPEEEAELPKRFAYPVVSHEEMPIMKNPDITIGGPEPAASGGKGKVNHANGRVLKGPSPTRLPKGVTFHKESGGEPTMDVSNPPKTDIEQDPNAPRDF